MLLQAQKTPGRCQTRPGGLSLASAGHKHLGLATFNNAISQIRPSWPIPSSVQISALSPRRRTQTLLKQATHTLMGHIANFVGCDRRDRACDRRLMGAMFELTTGAAPSFSASVYVDLMIAAGREPMRPTTSTPANGAIGSAPATACRRPTSRSRSTDDTRRTRSRICTIS